MDPILTASLLSWSWRPDVILVVGGFGAVYVRGWWRLRRRGASSAPGWRLGLYLAGLAALCLALRSPIDALGSLLFFVHMIQHELLTVVAPPLLLLGNPLPIILWSLPRRVRQRVGELLSPGARLRRGLWALTLMPVTWPVYVVTVGGWHVPAAYETALRSAVVHNVQHLSFFTVALLFWWPIVDPAPRLHGHIHHALRVGYAVVSAFQSQALGLILAFFPRLLYPHYQTVPRLWGYSPLQDQSAGGLIMMQFEGLLYLLVIMVLVARMFSYSERMTRLQEEHELEP